MKHAVTALSLFLVMLGSPVAEARDRAGVASMQGPWDRIAFELRSWGQTIATWTMESDGGRWTEFTKKDAPPHSERRVEHVLESAAGKRFRELSAIIARLPSPPPKCEDRMPDFPYGIIRLTRDSITIEIAFDSGCQGARYGVFLDVLKEADARMISWAEADKARRSEASQP